MQEARRVHLDFHTSPFIEGVGKKFDKKQFQNALIKGCVDSVTLFAKCHHGYMYYPSKVGQMHPGLDFDLLGAQIEAAHEIGVKTPIYITVGWSAADIERHPEWAAYDFDTKAPKTCGIRRGAAPDDPRENCSWENLCPTGEYKDLIARVTKEVCERYAPIDGIFYDICFFDYSCVCPHCVAGMKQTGLDPADRTDAEKYYVLKRLEFMKEMRGIISSYAPSAPVFFNGGADMYRPQYHAYQSHFELEDLPTSGGGYDKLPIRAKFFSQTDRFCVGMTGKFHAGWGEFGGFKNPEALKYECANFLSFGAGCSVGDQLHPCGEMDAQTYENIGYAYRYVKSIENYCLGGKAVASLGICLTGDEQTDQGLNLLLMENQLDYCLITEESDLSELGCIVIPSGCHFSAGLRDKIQAYIKSGKSALIMGDSVKNFTDLGISYIGKSHCDVDYVKVDFNIGVSTPFLFYESSHIVAAEGFEKLAEIYQPFFNRTYEKYCSHGNTPFRLQPSDHAGMLKRGNLIYISHDLCKMYYLHAAYYHKKYFTEALKKIYSDRPFEVDLMSCGRARMRQNTEKKFYALHLLYAPFHSRGDVCVLEDFPILHSVGVTLRIRERVKKISLQPQNIALDWSDDGEKVRFTVPKIKTHQLIVIEY